MGIEKIIYDLEISQHGDTCVGSALGLPVPGTMNLEFSWRTFGQQNIALRFFFSNINGSTEEDFQRFKIFSYKAPPKCLNP